MSKIPTLRDFYDLVLERKRTLQHERYGQALFNTLHAVRPALAEEIRSGPFDPFYVNDPDKLEACIHGIERAWMGTKIEPVIPTPTRFMDERSGEVSVTIDGCDAVVDWYGEHLRVPWTTGRWATTWGDEATWERKGVAVVPAMIVIEYSGEIDEPPIRRVCVGQFDPPPVMRDDLPPTCSQPPDGDGATAS